MELIQIAQSFGIPVVILCVFMWWAYKKDKSAEKRYDLVCARLTELENYQRGELQDLVVKSSGAMKESAVAQTALATEIRRRPCLKEA